MGCFRRINACDPDMNCLGSKICQGGGGGSELGKDVEVFTFKRGWYTSKFERVSPAEAGCMI